MEVKFGKIDNGELQVILAARTLCTGNSLLVLGCQIADLSEVAGRGHPMFVTRNMLTRTESERLLIMLPLRTRSILEICVIPLLPRVRPDKSIVQVYITVSLVCQSLN